MTRDGQSGDRERCLCGHYKSEHNRSPYEWEQGTEPRCDGAYGTLAADADDQESVEVRCHCDRFSAVEPNYHEVRS